MCFYKKKKKKSRKKKNMGKKKKHWKKPYYVPPCSSVLSLQWNYFTITAWLPCSGTRPWEPGHAQQPSVSAPSACPQRHQGVPPAAGLHHCPHHHLWSMVHRIHKESFVFANVKCFVCKRSICVCPFESSFKGIAKLLKRINALPKVIRCGQYS